MEGSFPLGRDLPSKKEAFSGKEAVHWDESFSVGKEPPIGKRFTVRREIRSKKEVTQCGK